MGCGYSKEAEPISEIDLQKQYQQRAHIRKQKYKSHEPQQLAHIVAAMPEPRSVSLDTKRVPPTTVPLQPLNMNVSLQSCHEVDEHGWSVYNWLHSIKLVDYAPVFESHGFDDMEVISQLDNDDLDAMGIMLAGVRKKLLIYSKRLINTSIASFAPPVVSIGHSSPQPQSPGVSEHLIHSHSSSSVASNNTIPSIPSLPLIATSYPIPPSVMSTSTPQVVTTTYGTSESGSVDSSSADIPLQRRPKVSVESDAPVKFSIPAEVRRGRRVSVDIIDTSLAALQALPEVNENIEEARMDAIEELGILRNSKMENSALYSYSTDLCLKYLGTKYAAINIVDGYSLRNIAKSGTTSIDFNMQWRQDAPCNLVVHSPNGSYFSLDTSKDMKIQNSKFIVENGIRFYAGVALVHNNTYIGTICVYDWEPRAEFLPASIMTLKELAKATIKQMLMQKSHVAEQQRLMDDIEAQRGLIAQRSNSWKKLNLPDNISLSDNASSLMDTLSEDGRISDYSPRDNSTSWMENGATGDELNHLSWGKDWQHEFPMPPIPVDDKSRCDVVDSYQSLSAEPIFDKLCEIACQQFEMPIAMVSLVGREEVTIKGKKGLEVDSAPRQVAVCNYTVKKAGTFVVPNTEADPLFANNPALKHLGICFYAGTPLTTPDGVVIGTFCILDKQPNYRFDIQQQRKLEGLTNLVMRQVELRRLKLQNMELQKEKNKLHKKLLNTKEKEVAPESDIAYMCTDIEGSTPLWEQYPTEMAIALQQHDAIMRAAIAEFYGYEVGTEGDSFEVAFHTAIDAVKCALHVQEKLMDVEWPPKLSKSEYCKLVVDESGRQLFSGLRVRMVIHTTDPMKITTNPATHRFVYNGTGITLARQLGGFGHGGQIIVSDTTWQGINRNLNVLSNPYVVDLGGYQMNIPNNPPELDLVMLHQLIPASLGPVKDVFEVQGENVVHQMREGRTFPPLKSNDQVLPSYFDAPQGGAVTLVFAVVDGKQPDYGDAALTLLTIKFVSKLFTDSLLIHKGYTCHEEHSSYMLAFHTVFDAIQWCISVQAKLASVAWPTPQDGSKPKVPQVQFGIHYGAYEECRPHPLTGHMYYFGATVNRAARIANKAQPNQILASTSTILELQKTATPAMKKTILVSDEGEHALKGITKPVSLCSIVKRVEG